ncbi:MAG TPA: MBL fold metallo-hydrolase [Candidatus Thiothrix moscowensis]|uniref:MBL fold metallo-hydrolase n=1 Tax=unclassified Thiothrix TaxID=2636184 RepID=UPI0025E898EE|nr:MULTISPECIES: MBL fold metallo-hydrolase [unclassified Thiothrix]HRJ52848.1 MBL fold metallo-hydrolase [Candidatus Thiothrix moscowensis]HRJ93398.1 MBL fold metallo-hydrolase [Candidatus Thiothrix moscowensis]
MKQPVWHWLGGMALLALSLNTWAADKSIHQGIVDNYKAEKVSDHVYVIHGPAGQPSKENQGFINNPGFIVGDSEVAVVDPGSSAAIGRAVLAHIRKVTDKPVTKVFITHIHGDHWLGNQAFKEANADTRFYASAGMIEEAKNGAGDSWVETMNTMTENATAGTEIVIPGEPLSQDQAIKVGNVTVKAHLVEGKAHTSNEVMFEVVEDKLLFTGDTISNKRLIMMDEGSFPGSASNAERISAMDVKTIVPGHGATGDKAIVTAYGKYMSTLYSAVKELRETMEAHEMKPKVIEKLTDSKDWHSFDEILGKHISLAILEAEQEDF